MRSADHRDAVGFGPARQRGEGKSFLRRQRILERDAPASTRPSSSGKHNVHGEIGGAEAACALAPCGAPRRRADDLQHRDAGASSGVGSPPPPAAKAVVVTMTAGSKPRERVAQERGGVRVFQAGDEQRAGARPRAVSAAQSASIGAVSAASSMAR